MALLTFIVEDSAVILQGLRECLEETSGIRVVGDSGTEAGAAEWLSQHANDWNLVVIDLFLAQGSGLGVLRSCALRRPNQHAIVLTNYATADMRRICLEMKADALFDKSTEVEEFIDCCTRLEASLAAA